MVTQNLASNPLPSIVEVFADAWVPLRTPLLLNLVSIVEKHGTKIIDIVYIATLLDYLVAHKVLEARYGEGNNVELKKIIYG
jgi:hypothetical protein